jgi:hypothetical protein
MSTTRCVHYVGFRDDRFNNAKRVFGGPVIIHRGWDTRAKREIGPDDIVVFADGPAQQEPHRMSYNDLDEKE